VLSPLGRESVARLVEGSCDVGQGARNRRCGFARLMDGELPRGRGSKASPPKEAKPAADYAKLRLAGRKRCARFLGDGNSGGLYERSERR